MILSQQPRLISAVPTEELVRALSREHDHHAHRAGSIGHGKIKRGARHSSRLSEATYRASEASREVRRPEVHGLVTPATPCTPIQAQSCYVLDPVARALGAYADRQD